MVQEISLPFPLSHINEVIILYLSTLHCVLIHLNSYDNMRLVWEQKHTLKHFMLVCIIET